MHIAIYVGGAVLFFVLIMVSIALHEIGHLIPGKIFGVKTSQYFVGFGKTLWSTRRGETEYGVKAVLLGGYCRFIGMYPPDPQSGKVRSTRTGIFQQVADTARQAEWEEISPADDGRLFYQKRVWKKLVVMFAGPAMNLLLAFGILLGVGLAYGFAEPSHTVGQVSECIIPAKRQQSSDPSQRHCKPGDPVTPAHRAGMRHGDVIVGFNGHHITSWQQLSARIRHNLDHRAAITVRRHGRLIHLKPVHTVISGVQTRNDPSHTVQAGFLGVSPIQRQVRGGPVTVATKMWTMSKQSVSVIARFPVKIYDTAADLVRGKPRDVNGPMSIVGASRVAGEVAATHRIDLSAKTAELFSLLGSVNLFVALFNFVPLMPLDGGHIIGAIYEAIKRSLARLFRRPDPGHADTAKMLPIAYVVGVVIAISGVVLVIADLVDPITLF